MIINICVNMCANTCDNNVGKHVCKHVCNGPKGPNYKLPIMVTYARTDGHTIYRQTLAVYRVAS